VLFLGDYIYEYPNARQMRSRACPPAAGCTTLDDYRQRYALHKSASTDLQAMHAACPWLVTWDDHEVQNDYAGLHEPATAGRRPVADFAARRAAAYQAFYEHMPLRASVLTQALAGLASWRGDAHLWPGPRSVGWPPLFLLDDRQYRDPQVCNRDGRLGSSLVNPERLCQLGGPAAAPAGCARRSNGWTAPFEQAAGGPPGTSSASRPCSAGATSGPARA
jgi:alkaline phosphatase D